MCDCNLKKELEVDEDTLTALITGEDDFSIISSRGIYRVSRNNDEFIRFLYQERKQIMSKNLNRSEKQWRLM